MTPEQALSLGIFAINTMLAPDASSEEDVARLDAHGHEAVKILAQLRDSAKGLERALPDAPRQPTTTFCAKSGTRVHSWDAIDVCRYCGQRKPR